MLSVAIVSQNTEFCQKAKKAFAGQDFSASIFSDAEAALQFLKTHKTDFIISDLLMPVSRDGWFLQYLWEQKNKTPLLGVCQKMTPALRQAAFDAGVYDLVGYEISETDLRGLVEGGKKNAPPDFKDSKGKILVVDDEEIVREFLTGFFLDRGYEVKEAVSGHDCMELVRSYQPLTVFLDINMPGLDGLTTLQAIKQLNSKIGVVMATGIQNAEVIKKALSFGADHYVLKPFNLLQLEMILLARLAVTA